jgi:hypothetical protein
MEKNLNNLTIFLDGGVHNGKEFHFESWDDFFDKKAGACLPSGYILSDVPYDGINYSYMSTEPFSRSDNELVLQHFGQFDDNGKFTMSDNFPGDLNYLLRDMYMFLDMHGYPRKENDETPSLF